jgi:hypothetical protein
MTLKQMEDAKIRALTIFDQWNDVTGAVAKNTGWYYELQSVIEDAVECGVQAGLGIFMPLQVEKGE